jgi:hypothetical protein
MEKKSPNDPCGITAGSIKLHKNIRYIIILLGTTYKQKKKTNELLFLSV